MSEFLTQMQSLKYYHDSWWYYYSAIGFIPLVLITIYKYKNQPSLKEIEIQKSRKQLLQDKLVVLLIFYSLPYYIIDALLRYYDGQDEWSVCKYGQFYHHLGSSIMLPFIITQFYFPWWLVGVPAVHAMLLLFPESHELEYVYGFFIFWFQYFMLTKPYRNMFSYRMIQFGAACVYVTLTVLHFSVCSNGFQPGRGYVV